MFTPLLVAAWDDLLSSPCPLLLIFRFNVAGVGLRVCGGEILFSLI
jgi:hypothetical protein